MATERPRVGDILSFFSGQSCSSWRSRGLGSGAKYREGTPREQNADDTHGSVTQVDRPARAAGGGSPRTEDTRPMKARADSEWGDGEG